MLLHSRDFQSQVSDVNIYAVCHRCLPVLYTLIVLIPIVWVIYLSYLIILQIRYNATSFMSAQNMTWSSKGVRVSVRGINEEDYVSRTQTFFVRAWLMGDKSRNRDIDMKKHS
jgi:hypothetical protein